MTLVNQRKHFTSEEMLTTEIKTAEILLHSSQLSDQEVLLKVRLCQLNAGQQNCQDIEMANKHIDYIC